MSVAITTQHSGDQLSSVLAGRRSASGNVGSADRWLSVVAGGLLAAYAAKRRSPFGMLVGIAGAGLLFRGITGTFQLRENAVVLPYGRRSTDAVVDASDTRARLGGSGGLLVGEKVTIRRPIDEVYRFWRQLDNLPKFLGHLQSVTVKPDGTSHWVANGPAGMSVEWDARIINEVENKIIGWQSLDGSQIATAGSVNFRRSGANTTVRVRFQYDPPAGKLGAAVAALFGEAPGRSVRDDLARLKSLLETGDVTAPRYSPSQPSA